MKRVGKFAISLTILASLVSVTYAGGPPSLLTEDTAVLFAVSWQPDNNPRAFLQRMENAKKMGMNLELQKLFATSAQPDNDPGAFLARMENAKKVGMNLELQKLFATSAQPDNNPGAFLARLENAKKIG